MDQISNSFQKYFLYLKKRSFIGFLYRNLYLYPTLSRYMDGKLLDVGCGIGDMLNFRPNSVGADVNQYNVNYCLARGLCVSLIKDGLLDYCSEEFDSVLLDNVLEHIQDPKKLIGQIKKVLKKNGKLIVGVPGFKGFNRDDDHKLLYEEQDLIFLANKSGFEIVKFFYMPLFKSKFLSRTLRQYVIYSVWIKK